MYIVNPLTSGGIARLFSTHPPMAERVKRLKEWNQPVWWPLVLIAAGIAAMVWVAVRSFRRRERMNARGEVSS